MTTKSAFEFNKIPPLSHSAPPLETMQARDGTVQSYRFYESPNLQRAIILIHGSSGHGDYMDSLAQYLSKERKIGAVYVPNLRGHFGSGSVRGDCSYIGQLEDDIADFIRHFRLERQQIYMVGHSSGGGFAIRFAGGKYGDLIKGYVLLAPAIPHTPVMRKKSAGGWASASITKYILLSILNSFGISWLNHMKVIRFNKPERLQDGREALSYSYNLAQSYHPRKNYWNDVQALKDRFILFVGKEDEGMDGEQYVRVMQVPGETVHIVPEVKHLDVVWNPGVMHDIADWIETH